MLAHPVPVHHVQFQPNRLRDLPRRISHPGGRHHVGRMVHQVTGKHRRLRQHCSHRGAAGQSRDRVRVALHDGHALDPGVGLIGVITGGGPVPVATVGIELVQAEQRALRDGLGRLGGVQSPDASAVGDGRVLADALPAQEPGHIAADAPYRSRVEVLGFAQAGHHYPFGGNPIHGVDQSELTDFALDLTVRNQLRNRSAQRAVHGAGAACRMRHALEQIHHQRRRCELGRVAGGNLDRCRHAASPGTG